MIYKTICKSVTFHQKFKGKKFKYLDYHNTALAIQKVTNCFHSQLCGSAFWTKVANTLYCPHKRKEALMQSQKLLSEIWRMNRGDIKTMVGDIITTEQQFGNDVTKDEFSHN